MANLSRKYRPQTFGDISGQKSLTEILRKEIEQEKIGHAYLFSGPRGVGKTTAARIFAKAVNCLEPKAGEPCLACKNCQKTAQGSIDIIEMDAASHTGVDNIRDAVVEHVRFVPSELKYKVYVIDEAHMLSTSAWNALLKTVEEPPAHAIFIFATTEKHKVPATIVSRCQRFDFKRIEANDIRERLSELAKEEGFEVSDNVLKAVSAKSDGCLRDAENLLGQLFSLGERKITDEIASLVLPPSQLPYAVDLLNLAFARKLPEVLERIQEIEQEGAALMPLFDDLISSVRALMLAGPLEKEARKLESGDETDKALAKLVGVVQERELINVSLLLMERRKDAKQGLDPRFALEMAMCAIAVGATGENQGGGTSAPQPPSSESRPKAPAPPKPVEKPAEPVAPKDAPVRPPPVAKAEKEVKPPVSQATDDRKTASINEIRLWWPKLLDAMESNKSLLFILKLAKPIEMKGDTLRVSFQYPYHKQTMMDNSKNKILLENALRTISGNSRLIVDSVIVADTGTQDQPKQNLDTVSKLLDNFGGQLVA